VEKSLKVMVVDDTITYRMIMKKVAESIPGILVSATASNGKLALDKIRNLAKTDSESTPDVLLLDVEMPVMDGLTTLKQVRQQYPDIATVMVSALSRSNANIVLECLNAGALDFVTKPLESNIERAKSALMNDLEPILSVIVQDNQRKIKIKTPIAPSAENKESPAVVKPSSVLAPARTTSTTGRKTPLRKPLPSRMPLPTGRKPQPVSRSVTKAVAAGKITKPDLILIGSSTGGPVALTKVLSSLKGALPVPTLIVQHMPPVFTASLAAQLTRTSGLQVKEAEDGMILTPGSITLAMGGRHMVLKNDNRSLRVVLNDGPKVNECRPAVDVLFMSVMASFKGNVLAIILTGMGRDGANGVDALKRAGRTYCITQNKQSCVVYGMPRTVDEKNLSDQSLPLDQIGPEISKICS
jgi:two-component system, chemotaxis family, protein-glutamate methylesterase/glutaminase